MNNLCAATAPPQSTSNAPSRDGRQSDDAWAWTNDSSSVRNYTTLRETTKAIFIKRLELTINGTPIDQVRTKIYSIYKLRGEARGDSLTPYFAIEGERQFNGL